MTSRDFGIVTLRSAVAYRRNNTLVPPNNVYVTSTNGAAIFSDTLTISTINVSTINGSGVGGGVSSISSGINISITGTVSTPIVNVDINSTLLMNGFPIVDTTGLLTLSSIGGNISITTSLPGTSIVNNIELNNATGIAISTLGPAGAPISLPIALNASGDINLTAFGNINTYSFNNTTVAASNIINLSTLSTSIVLDQASQGITIIANNDININASTLINGTIKVASTFYDNNASSGTSGQVLTAGTGGQVVWSTISGGGGSMNVTISSGSGTYIIPGSAMYSVSYTAIGGGGGGGGGGSNYDPNPGAGGGGASGTLVSGTFVTMAGSPLVYTIGAGGTGGNNALPNGIAGAATTATLPSGYGTVTAAGGDLGTYNGNGGGNGGNGGAYGGGGGGYYGVPPGSGGTGGTGTIAGGGNGTASGGSGGAGGGGAPGGSGGAYGGGGGGGGWAGGAGGSGGGGSGAGGGGYGSGGGGGGSNGGLGATNPGGNGSDGVILLTLTPFS
jgi:hypothetical protein